MTKRIFIACVLSRRLQTEIENWEKKFGNLSIRWIPLENLHITLVPPWNEEHPEEVIRLLKMMPKTFRHFQIDFTNVSFGPEEKHPRLIWATGILSKDVLLFKKQLLHLFSNEKKESDMIHITLARFREQPRDEFSEKISWQETIATISVIESKLTEKGSIYKVLAQIPL